tara:strand:- start:3278 stop:3391 length:114 start_codon:yes stop_codon:yes gene_type:complete
MIDGLIYIIFWCFLLVIVSIAGKQIKDIWDDIDRGAK